MEINLKKKSWHLALYKWTYCTKNTPASLCNYFWGLLIAIASIPLTIWSLFQQLLNIKPRHYFERLAQSLLAALVLFAVVCSVTGVARDPIGFLKGLGFVVLVIIAIILIFFIFKGVKGAKNMVVESDSVKIIGGQIKSYKMKICPKINWED